MNFRRVIVAALCVVFGAGEGWANPNINEQMLGVHNVARRMFGLPERCDRDVPCTLGTPCRNCGPQISCAKCSCVNLTGTGNMKMVGRAWYWGWTLLNLPKEHPERACARQGLLKLINDQQTYGHYSLDADGGEVLTISHGPHWLAGMAAAYLFALTNGSKLDVNKLDPDEKMLAAVRKWWADEFYVWDQIANGSGQIRAPGARFEETNDHQWRYREQIYTLLKGQVPPGMSNWPNDRVVTAGWIFDELRRRGHSPALAVTPPADYKISARLYDTLCLYRRGADFLYYFPRMSGVLKPLFWVRREKGQPPYAPVITGTPTNPPLSAKPTNFPGATVVQLKGIDQGAITCPSPGALR